MSVFWGLALLFVGYLLGRAADFYPKPEPPQKYPPMAPPHDCQETALRDELQKVNTTIQKLRHDHRKLLKTLREQNDADLFLTSTRIAEKIKAGEPVEKKEVAQQNALLAQQQQLAQMQQNAYPLYSHQGGVAVRAFGGLLG